MSVSLGLPTISGGIFVAYLCGVVMGLLTGLVMVRVFTGRWKWKQPDAPEQPWCSYNGHGNTCAHVIASLSRLSQGSMPSESESESQDGDTF